ncbi:MAG: septum formation initiator family protein [Deltaproteobacteria bacterium]|nr:septum formation initiator family protein [Deltaproteobacteria bacterium]
MRIFKKLWLPTLLLSYVLLALSTAIGEHGFVHLWSLRQEQRSLESTAVALLEENKDLRDRISRLKTDNRYLEKVVREELKFARKGEFLYLFRGSSEAPEQGRDETVSDRTHESTTDAELPR